MKQKEFDKISMEKTDAIETAEMLRASFTLLRMAFGACAMSAKPRNLSDDACKALDKAFNNCFVELRSCLDYFYSLATASDKDNIS